MEIIANNLESFAMEFEEKYFFVRVDRTYKSDKKKFYQMSRTCSWKYIYTFCRNSATNESSYIKHRTLFCIELKTKLAADF